MEQALKDQWRELRHGKKEALFSLYNGMYFHLVRFGLKFIADDELVKDCINQLFLKLWEKHSSLPEVSEIRSYLFTAFRRLILDELSYRSKIDAAINQLASEDRENELSYEEIIINIQKDEKVKVKLHKAISQLTPRQKELIRLKFFEGLSYEQIALETSQTVKTAYNTIYDAIKMLRKLLK